MMKRNREAPTRTRGWKEALVNEIRKLTMGDDWLKKTSGSLGAEE